MEPQRKLLQTVRIALLVSIALYVFIGERIGRSTQSTPDRNVYFAITLFAITTVGMTFAVWRLFVLRSEVILADQPEDTAALKRWRTGYIITYTLCETVALFGFVRVLWALRFRRLHPSTLWASPSCCSSARAGLESRSGGRSRLRPNQTNSGYAIPAMP